MLDNFFRIGGDSLLIVKLKMELEKFYGVSVNIVDLFNYSSIKDQAKLFEKISNAEDVKEIDIIKF